MHLYWIKVFVELLGVKREIQPGIGDRTDIRKKLRKKLKRQMNIVKDRWSE